MHNSLFMVTFHANSMFECGCGRKKKRLGPLLDSLTKQHLF